MRTITRAVLVSAIIATPLVAAESASAGRTWVGVHAEKPGDVVPGPQGEKGEKGEKGEPGERGPKGEPGENGKDGKDGVNGKDGKDGLNGLDHVCANTPAGEPGRNPHCFPKGDKGDTGPEGPRGPQGPKGDDGLTPQISFTEKVDGCFSVLVWFGDETPKVSPPICDGDNGLDGAVGPRGPEGEDGQRGEAGKDGRDGEDGARGKTGYSKTVLVHPDGTKEVVAGLPSTGADDNPWALAGLGIGVIALGIGAVYAARRRGDL